MNDKRIIASALSILIFTAVLTKPQETVKAETVTEEPADHAYTEKITLDEYAEWTDMQVWAHETAESARAMAINESNPIIVECQRIWHEEENIKNPPVPEGIPVEEVEPEYAEPEMTYLGNYYITGYDACVQCCGKTDGITASGVKATVSHTVAMCKDFPFGTEIYIADLGFYVVEDRGVGKNCVDIFCNNHSECYALTGHYDVYIVNN